MQRTTQPDLPSIPEISVREAWHRIQTETSSGGPILVDVREREEYLAGHAASAVNIPLSELRDRETEVPRDRDVLLICHVGQRSLFAARYLRAQGIERVVNVDGGTDAWEYTRQPMER